MGFVKTTKVSTWNICNTEKTAHVGTWHCRCDSFTFMFSASYCETFQLKNLCSYIRTYIHIVTFITIVVCILNLLDQLRLIRLPIAYSWNISSADSFEVKQISLSIKFFMIIFMFKVMHLDISIITLTIILPHISIVM